MELGRGVCAWVCVVRRALASEEQCRSLIGDAAAILNAIANDCCKNIMLGQVLSDVARMRLEDDLALVCSHVPCVDSPIASAEDVDVVRPISEEYMTLLDDTLRSLMDVGEQIDDQLFADQVSCLRCMIRGRQNVSALKLMMLSALSREDSIITEERAKCFQSGTLCRPWWGILPGCISDPHRWQTST